ncbi:MAG: hydroxymethylglutaryl-CoA lyase [Deltaproteobacteria bacterium]|nr:hydroxymethylglutaryl-CoA lyase [Deltaproteobacteria bacterium]
MNLPDNVKIREVSTRDGFQSWPEFVPTDIKIKILNGVKDAGIKVFETTAFVSPKAVPQMADAAEVIRLAPHDGVKHGALVPNLKGAQLAVDAGADQLNVVIAASEAHNKANFNRTIAESLSYLEPIFKLAQDNNVEVIGALTVAFGCPFSGKVDEKDVLRLVETYVSYGCNTVGLGDTTGMATPLRVKSLVGLIKDRFPEKEILLHLHNNRGSAMANLYAGMEAGATFFDTSLGGIGGCPNVPQASGNLATEDVVCMLEDMGIETGIKLDKLLKVAHYMEDVLGQTLPGQVLKSGPIFDIRDDKIDCSE